MTVTASASISGFTLSVGSYQMTVNVSMAANDTVTITYDENLIQSIKKGNASVLDKRTGADDLLAECGKINRFSVSASSSITAVFSVRGCWL